MASARPLQAMAASITDPRQHRPAPLPPGPPLLLTMIDAEEEFDWSRPFSRQATGVASMREQHLAQRIFDRHGVLPLYLVDHSVAENPVGYGPLREWHQAGRCEIGAQMHPWVNPPFVEDVDTHHSFAGNLPPALEHDKARHLTELLEQRFGARPRIYRTGRFGAGPRTAAILQELGYQADSSVLPHWQAPGQPLVPACAATPFWLDPGCRLLEIPVTSALVGRLARSALARFAPRLFRSGAERLGLTGLAARLRLLERIRLTPEGIRLEEAQRLVRILHAAGQRVFVLTYHSPSLAPGHTPYVRDLAERDRFLHWLDSFYAFFHDEIGGRMASWRDVHAAAGRG